MADNQFEIPAVARAEIRRRGYALPPDMSGHIERWHGWYTGDCDWYEERYAGVDGRAHKRRKLSLRPARRVCREWASLIANEMGAKTESPRANGWLQGYCAETGLFTLFQRGIERAFAMGTGAMALWFDVAEDGAAVRVRRYDAKMVVPLTWDEDGATECAFCTRATVRGEQAVQLQMHVLDGGTYHVVTKVWVDGEAVSPESLGIIEDFDTACETPTFCLLSPAIDNALQDASPYGVSVFEDAVGAMKVLDTAWTALYDETDLMRAVLMLPDTMIDVQQAGPDGEVRAVPFGDQEQRLYRLTSSGIGEEGKPYAFAPQMRTSSIYETYAAACAALGDECGFGAQYFKPDRAGGLKTATEVSADNSALMRNIRNHENALGKGLGRLLTALVECARIHCGAPVEDDVEPVEVVWDDSIITDTQAEKQQMLAEIAAGVVPRWMYLAQFYGMSEEEARAAAPAEAVLDAGLRMLDPEYLDEAADLVGAVYAEIEDEMLRYLSRLLLSGVDVLGQRGETALLLLAQTRAADLMAIVERHRGDVSRAVEATVADAIARSDAADLAVLGDAAAPRAEGTLPMQASLTARGIAEVLARDNVDMQSGALALWQSVVSRAVTRVNTGAATTEAALRAAVREMMRSGISAITYRDAETGRQTVTNRVDVAVRRHVRTQIQQDGLRRTMELCRASGCRLVEVTSHCGARPSHAEWQGNVYGLDGPCEVDGKSYRGLVDATGYGSVDGLGGANCRHSFGPWAPGTPRAYQPDPPHASGLSNDEVYRLRQGQRRRERAIRQAKRDLAGAQMVAGNDGSLANIAEVERAKARLAARQKGMRDFIAGADAKGSAPVLHRNPRREWAGDMPRVRKTDASRRTMGEFLDGDGARRALKARGLTEREAGFMVSAELGERGIPDASWKYLSKSTQRELFAKALTRRKPTEREIRRAKMRPVNEALYNSQKNYVERHGGVVMRGGEDVERHLDDMNADASHIGGVIFLRGDANTSEVLEEVYHFKQEQRGDYSEYDDGIRVLLMERDAQRYLVGVAERYNIPESETRQTELALEYYLRKLKEAGIDEGD